MDSIEFWHWWVAGILLLVLEVLAPTAFFLWMGVSAAAVGLVLLIVPTIEWQWQLSLFAIFSIVSIILWRLRLQKHPTPTDDDRLNHRTRQYIGRTFTLKEAMVDGVGKIYVDDSQWEIHGPDCDAGRRVKVISAEALTLTVELLPQKSDD